VSEQDLDVQILGQAVLMVVETVLDSLLDSVEEQTALWEELATMHFVVDQEVLACDGRMLVGRSCTSDLV
jgi:hypothetical protein